MSFKSPIRFMIEVASLQTPLTDNGEMREHCTTVYERYTEWCRSTGEFAEKWKVLYDLLKKMDVHYGNITKPEIEGGQKKGYRITIAELRKKVATEIREPNFNFDILDLDLDLE